MFTTEPGFSVACNSSMNFVSAISAGGAANLVSADSILASLVGPRPMVSPVGPCVPGREHAYDLCDHEQTARLPCLLTPDASASSPPGEKSPRARDPQLAQWWSDGTRLLSSQPLHESRHVGSEHGRSCLQRFAAGKTHRLAIFHFRKRSKNIEIDGQTLQIIDAVNPLI